MQPDTLIPNPANPQAWNRYSYVLGNPLRYSDPTGHRNCEEDGYNCDVPSSGGGGIIGGTGDDDDRFYILNNGGMIDIEHFNAGKEHWKQIAEAFGHKDTIKLTMGDQSDIPFSLEGIELLDDPELIERYLKFQQEYEQSQFTAHRSSGFTPEDIPSDMLGFLAGKYNMTIEQVAATLGGYSEIVPDFQEKPTIKGFTTNPAIRGLFTVVMKDCLTYSCGQYDWQNSSPRMKVPVEVDWATAVGHRQAPRPMYEYLDYPEPFDVLNGY